ncbi:MAG TPA: response regulator, partial [Mycoplana sp.]|nr:response regulator [Mycoplana sp.]
YAPEGPVARALQRTIETLGGSCRHLADRAGALAFAQGPAAAGLTDVIVDNRLSGEFRRELAELPAFADRRVRRIYLVNPEERTGRAIGNGEGYDAWLIRPLRERSLVEVLRGRMKGIEIRDAINDNRPLPGEPRAEEGPVRSVDSERILLAEDDPVNAMLVRSILAGAGFAVSVVEDFPALLRALDDGAAPPAVVITDLRMPGGDGPAIVRRLAGGEGPGLPVIVLTAEAGPDLRAELVASGAAAIIVKPAGPQLLLGEVSRLLATRSAR